MLTKLKTLQKTSKALVAIPVANSDGITYETILGAFKDIPSLQEAISKSNKGYMGIQVIDSKVLNKSK